MEGPGIPAACSAGIVTLGKSKFWFNGGNSFGGGSVATPTVVGGLTAAVAGFCVSDPPWRPGDGSGRGVFKTEISCRRAVSSSVAVAISCFRGMVASLTLADISA